MVEEVVELASRFNASFAHILHSANVGADLLAMENVGRIFIC